MGRLDKERQARLEPKRHKVAVSKITALGYEITDKDSVSIKFEFKGSTVTYFVYSGWATGKTIKDGRGIENLLKQIKNEDKIH